MRIGVVGAGVAGLAAGKLLADAGHEVVVFEKSRGLGGRMATRRVDGYVFDTGATTVTPRKSALADVIAEVDANEVVVVQRHVYTHAHGRVEAGDPIANADKRYAFRSGITVLAKHMAQRLDVRLQALVTEINADLSIHGEVFDRLILTAPLPQSELLLASMGDSRGQTQATYRSCLSVLLGYAQPTPDTPYWALIDQTHRNPLTWLSLESAKSPDRAPEGKCAIVAQMSPDYSRDYYTAADEAVIGDAVPMIARIFGPSFEHPEVAQVKKWRYSQPEITSSFEALNPPGSRVLVASDALIGGRIELAYDIGVRAAHRVLETA